ncbi:MAG: glycosyltransferase [Arcobacteraceae bacterium]
MIEEKDILVNWKNSEILVSVCCAVYNQKDFIKETLDSFISQKTDFGFEVLIHDDASTDGTSEILKEYEKKYPNIIKPIYQIENQYSKGLLVNHKFNFPRIKGRYLALCDGDDYWCDPLKLQKQVDFLETNSKFIGCSHNTKVLRTQQEKEEFIVNNITTNVFEIEDFTKGNSYFHTSSMVYRFDIHKEEILKLLTLHRGDWYISMVFASFGPIKYLDEVMSVYRIHDKGVWSELSAQEQVMKNLDAILKINKAFDYAYEENFMQLFARVFITSQIDKSIANLSKLFDSLSKEELVKIIFYIEQYTKKQEEHIAYEKELWQQREDHIQKIQSSFGWKVGSLIDKLRG